MASLRNLFGNSSAPDNNDALKFVAPKEKSAKQQSAALTSAASPTKPSVAAAPVQAPPATPSKAMASATVRLFKINPANNAYEPCAGGSPLGCVVMGSNVQFQIFVYNSQKEPQALIQISGSFRYTCRDLYMSCKDMQGNNWSILFDAIPTMTNFLRVVVAAVAQMNQRTTLPNDTNYFSCLLPGSTSTKSAASDEPALTAGMTAGVTFTAWELGDHEETGSQVPAEYSYPGDMIAPNGKYPPFLSVTSEKDVAKVKVGGNDEEPIGGLGKALVGYKKGDKVMIAIAPKLVFDGVASSNMIELRRRAVAWIVVEVEVVRVKSGEKKKKEESGPIPVAPAPTPVPAPVSDLTSRMAKLSGGGAAAQMAMTGGTAVATPQTFQPSPQQQSQQPAPQQQYQHQSSLVNPYQQPQQQVPQHPQMQQQYQQPPADTNPYAVALVAGQEARSSYMPNPTNATTMQPPQPAYNMSMSHDLSQNLMNISSSIMSLHQKVDSINRNGSSMVPKNSFQMKSTDLIAGIEALVNEYDASVEKMNEKIKEQSSSNSSASKERESDLIKDLERVKKERDDRDVKIEKLEEKIENLSNKNEKLMSDKTNLLEKQQDLYEKTNEYKNNSYSLQADLDRLKKNGSDSNNEADKQLISELKEKNLDLLEKNTNLQAQLKEQLSNIEKENNLEARLEEQIQQNRDLIDENLKSVSELSNIKNTMQSLETKIRELNEELLEKSKKIEELSVTSSTSAAPAAIEMTLEDILNREDVISFIDGLKNEHNQTNLDKNEEIEKLKKQLSELSNVATTANISPDKMKEIAQAIYAKAGELMSGKEANEDGIVLFETKEVNKVLRNVLKVVTTEYS